jgi:RNA polymerase-binding transcription factor DksA
VLAHVVLRLALCVVLRRTRFGYPTRGGRKPDRRPGGARVATFTRCHARVYAVGLQRNQDDERTTMPAHVDVGRARKRLLGERERLQRIADALSGETGEGASERVALSELSLADQHPADLGTEMFEREKDLSILERIEAERSDVEHALKRLHEATYGLCEACGREIAKARLEALPAARFCVDDQAAAEREARAG